MRLVAIARTLALAAVSTCVFAQVPNPTQAAAPQYLGDTPVFRVTATARTIKSINYRHREGSTTVDLVGTGLMYARRQSGRAKVDSKTGATKLDVTFSRLRSRTNPR